MKSLKTTFLAFSILLLACKKDKEPISELRGSWLMTTDINGQTGKPTLVEAGEGNIMKLGYNSYEIFRGGEVIKSGTYVVKTSISFMSKKEGKQLIFDGNTDGVRYYYTIKDNVLTVHVDAFDGPTSIYKRIR